MENNTDNTKNTKRWSKGGQNSLEDATNPHKIRESLISKDSLKEADYGNRTRLSSLGS